MERSALTDATGGLHGFPAAPTSFVGRAQAVDEVSAQLARDRLVTVTGPGGAGKTRLADVVARQVAGRFADGVWLAELAAVTDPAQVAAVVGTALGLRDLPSVAAADALAQALARRLRPLLHAALDCCGHLCAATQRPAEAITSWAAMSAMSGAWPVLSKGLDPARRESLRRQAAELLGPARARAAKERGAAMSLATATEFALLLAAEPQPSAAVTAAEPEPTAGETGPRSTVDGAARLARLSPRERELVTLVAQGRTDAQIAGQLYITVRTVGSHLDRIRDKTGCRRRADLTRLALSAGLV